MGKRDGKEGSISEIQISSLTWMALLPSNTAHAHNANTRQISFSVCAATPPVSHLLSSRVPYVVAVSSFSFPFLSSPPPPPISQDKQSALAPLWKDEKTQLPNGTLLRTTREKRHKRKMGLEVVNTEDGGCGIWDTKRRRQLPFLYGSSHSAINAILSNSCSNPSFSRKPNNKR